MAEPRIPVECVVEIENKKLRHSIYSFQLIQSIDTHHLLRVKLRPLVDKPSSESEFIDSADFTPFLGKPVTVTITPKGKETPTLLSFIGLVTEAQLQNDLGEINQIFLTAHSPTYLLDTAEKNRFYNEQSLSDICDSILSQYSIESRKMDIPTIKYEFCVQYGETDYQFIKRLAEQEGLWAYYDGRKFCISSQISNDTVELTWPDTLGSFGFNLSCRQQFFQRTVYDYEKKLTYFGKTKSASTNSNPSGIFRIPLDISESVLSQEGVLDFPKRVKDPKQLVGYLSIKKSESREKLVLGWGESTVPLLSVGKKAKIKNMTKEINGEYLVTQVIHYLDHSGNYHNEFECVPVDLAFPKKTQVRPHRRSA